jgi:hypothetical protein
MEYDPSRVDISHWEWHSFVLKPCDQAQADDLLDWLTEDHVGKYDGVWRGSFGSIHMLLIEEDVAATHFQLRFSDVISNYAKGQDSPLNRLFSCSSLNNS